MVGVQAVQIIDTAKEAVRVVEAMASRAVRTMLDGSAAGGKGDGRRSPRAQSAG